MGRLMSEGYSPNLPITVEQDATTPVASMRVTARGATFGDEYASTRVRPAERAQRSCAAGTRKRAKPKQAISKLHMEICCVYNICNTGVYECRVSPAAVVTTMRYTAPALTTMMVLTPHPPQQLLRFRHPVL